MSKFILGTATFGTGYGIANKDIRIKNDLVHKMITFAQNIGIKEFDTAPAYGEAENLLGTFLNPKIEFRISSKISVADSETTESVLNSVKRTLLRTKCSKLANLYLHDPEVLFNSNSREIISGLRELLQSDLVDRIGISAYSLESILRSKELLPELSVFQLPENICDQRLLNSTELMDLAGEGNIFNVRSLFLQGLLLMKPKEIPSKISKSQAIVHDLKTFAQEHDLSVLDLCISYGQQIPWASGLIIGAVNPDQLKQIIESKAELPTLWRDSLRVLPDDIVDPRYWH